MMEYFTVKETENRRLTRMQNGDILVEFDIPGPTTVSDKTGKEAQTG